MMNEEVINAGIKGYESYVRAYFEAPSYRIPEYTQAAIKRAIIWAVTQYIMNTTDQFKEFVVSQTQSPKSEVSKKQRSQYGSIPDPVAFYKGKWYWDFYELVDNEGLEFRLNRPVISEEHGKQLYRSV